MITRLIPTWLYGAVAAAALMCALSWHERGVGADVVRKEWAAADAAALAARTKEISALTIKQAATAAAIEEKHDDEIASVRDQLRAAGRMRLPAFCKPAVAAPATTAGAQSGDGASAGAGFLPERTDADIRSLIISAEESAATARAAQTFIRENGMAQ